MTEEIDNTDLAGRQVSHPVDGATYNKNLTLSRLDYTYGIYIFVAVAIFWARDDATTN